MVKIFKSILAWRGVVAKRYERYRRIRKHMKIYERIKDNKSMSTENTLIRIYTIQVCHDCMTICPSDQ